jgi:adenylate cyclase
VYFYRERQRVLAGVLDVAHDIGRQRDGEPAPSLRLDQAGKARVILAPINEVEVSRSHVLLEPGPEGNVRITNQSRTLPLRLPPHDVLQPGESRTVTPPALVQFGIYAVRVDPPEEEDELKLEALPERTMPPGKRTDPTQLTRLSGATFDESSLLRWIETVLGVFQSAASSSDFPERAAFAVVKIVGLDTAAMMRCDADGRWRVEAIHSQSQDQNQQNWTPSRTLLGRVLREARTFRHVPHVGSDTPHSLQDVSALVAAPILDGNGNVIGALYGDRRRGGAPSPSGFRVQNPEITAFEAKLIELLASGIAAGIARLEEEQAALAARVQFEQFFTPQLATQLEQDPQLLEGRNAEVTILFADIRGFSAVSERLGPASTMEWIQDTMGALSHCVLDHDGVLVDYIGDELMAMWGAPVSQANHAHLACCAARQMHEALRDVEMKWRAETGVPLRLGIGLNSGTARVGNTGSTLKFKYGPLGDVVNVASRVQGATKYLGADCLVTGRTLQGFSDDVATRRLARVRVVNIEQPIDLYEVVARPPEDWSDRCGRYEQALRSLEREDLAAAAQAAQELLADYPDDRAVEALANRVTQAQQTRHSGESRGDSSVWQLPGK